MFGCTLWCAMCSVMGVVASVHFFFLCASPSRRSTFLVKSRAKLFCAEKRERREEGRKGSWFVDGFLGNDGPCAERVLFIAKQVSKNKCESTPIHTPIQDLFST